MFLLLCGLAKENVQLIGSLALVVTVKSIPNQVTIMVDFLIVNCPSTYNPLLEGKPFTNLELSLSSIISK